MLHRTVAARYSNGSQSSDGTYDNAGNDATTDGSDYSNDTQDVTTPQTDAAQPVYMTINSACYMRSYPDYGDNIIGQFEAGTTVEFLGDEGGWYKVSVNGQVGYMGARFFN
ncbi:MAG: SH3 domain-containing protein [Lachnospiraceae bacterium]